ncbi:hypothetical protein CVT24_001752 [Panaeolus cyanescens]|uniref:G domain-containing protein n=1 Tax=Panaeolus cyanescens TaxID=181874 RepID=A0A409YU70_9AGAR|nr:hypothetical protein CVT24_001752 [Panaeolus cyanescens]
MFVKPEPQDSTLEDTKQPLDTFLSQNNLYSLKHEPENSNINLYHGSNVLQGDAMKNGPDNHALAPKMAFTVFQNAQEIDYIPESALKEGIGMVKSIKDALKKLELGSKLRKEVWAREIDNLLNQGTPKTLIAVCGATGAGKSSVLNAVLDDNVVPTSGMRACTAVVTEISYNKKSTIDADIAFLSEAEWRQELDVLLHDLVDEDGNIRRINDLKSDAGIAWQKVHAVYPTIDQERLVRMSTSQILESDRNIMSILGTVKTISAKDSKAFGKEIAKYIDSKEKRVKKDKKDKEKEKEKKSLSIMDQIQKMNGTSSGSSSKTNDLDAPALWPLIRQVKVRCKAEALSTGAVLVDLPGVADANAARDNIAKDYMKKCNCIWILAPIQRAVDDKTAKDLLGDAFRTQLKMGKCNGVPRFFPIIEDSPCSFPLKMEIMMITPSHSSVSSKNDDISCSEVIPVLGLDEDPELESIEDRILEHMHETSKYKKLKVAAEKEIKRITGELNEVRSEMKDHQAHLEALEDGVPFVSTIKKTKKESKGKKRKNTRGGKKSPKRRRSVPNSSDVEDDDDFIDDDDDSEVDSEQSDNSDSDSDDGDSSKKSGSDDSDSEKENDEEPEVEEITEDILKEKIKKCKDSIKTIRGQLDVVRNEKKTAADALAVAEKQMAKAQREKNAFCALKRSEYARGALKNDFREGLKELDDAAAEERDPENFNPTQNLRDYDAIDLPVFTVSSRDYVRLKGQVKGDGAAACFSNVEDTGIPDLQKWCQKLTVASRDRAARIFMTQLKGFATSIQTYVQGIGDVTAIDRNALREKWESNFAIQQPQHNVYEEFWAGLQAQLDGVDRKPKFDASGKPAGITPRLCSIFEGLVKKCVEDLQRSFKDGLEDKCHAGASHAAAAALPTLDEFTSSMHWATYRATLRRHGSWRRDLNVELINPFTKNIASTWSKVFESDLFGDFEAETIEAINDLVKEVEQSAAQGLKDRARLQGEQSIEEARVALRNAVTAVKEAMNVQQKEVSRCLAPHVQQQLVDGYEEAMTFRGVGSVARQKTFFRGYVSENKDTMFDDGADTVMGRLTQAAEAVGETLSESMDKLAQKVEVSLAVLWEGVRDDPQQLLARQGIIDTVKVVQEQILLWGTADKLKQTAARANVRDANAMEVDA